MVLLPQGSAMSAPIFSLDQLGWRACFSTQLTLEDLGRGRVARVSSVHRSRIEALCETGPVDVVATAAWHADGATPVAVGDWVFVEHGTGRLLRLLQRQSVIRRLAAGEVHREQPIAANVDTAFVVTSCNADFNPSRLERYLAVVLDAGVAPVIVLTKADLCEDASRYLDEAARVAVDAAVIAVDARDRAVHPALADWLGRGQSVVFMGSSGVGKSTLVNTLTGESMQVTQGIREDDARGRHTTTTRQLIPMPGGAWLIDVPGMRELRIGAAQAGLSEAFGDLEALARSCRFRDCAHGDDSGCALRAAVEAGALDPRRLGNFLKLHREAARATQADHVRREAFRRTGRLHRKMSREREQDKRGPR
jgi:ribosome biogenesis GTPase